MFESTLRISPIRGEPTYPLLNVVVMTFAAVISGADHFVAFAR